MSFEIKKATRQGIKPLIAFYSESGHGKTYSALLMARGLAGVDGRIIMIETEGGRGELYADVKEIGGYDVIRLEEPFTPKRYIEAIKTAQDAGAAVIIVDSCSHEWEGVGGVNDMAMENESRSGRPGLHNWKKPKFEHALFCQALARAKTPIIACVRAKYKTRQGKNSKGKTEIVRDNHVSPIQAEDFIFEATCHGEIMTDHKLRLTKWSHPKLKTCFPVNGMITIETGELIKEWCQGSEEPVNTPEAKETAKVTPGPDRSVITLKMTLWGLLEAVHKGSKDKFGKWLIDKAIITEDEDINKLDASRLEIMIDQVVLAKNEGA